MNDTPMLHLHLEPASSTNGLQIQDGDYDLELNKDGDRAVLWLGRHMVATWTATDGKVTLPLVGLL